ncbi:MAG: GNAT family N-acetyltransferase [Gammaproteobacteria bacterium]|nr:GNAT family N-acetyltransferase [Gammaproteobacteria bacterium]
MSFPEFRTKRLWLTKITSSDVESIFELFSSPDVVKYYDLEVFNERAQAEQLIRLFESRHESSLGIRWAIRPKETGQLIGTCGFNSWSEKMRNATIGYDLKPEYWNRGIATEALFEIIRAAFAGLLPCGALHRIQADTIPGNVASEKVLLKLGFKEEGTRRECAYLRGSYHDMKYFGLLRTDFKEK